MNCLLVLFYTVANPPKEAKEPGTKAHKESLQAVLCPGSNTRTRHISRRTITCRCISQARTLEEPSDAGKYSKV
jgi:hypothetical protein